MNKKLLLTNTLSTPMVYITVMEDKEIEEKIKESFDLGIAALQNKNAQQALTHFIEVVQKQPTNLACLNNIAALYASIGKTADSIRLFEKTVETHPKSFQLRYNLGTLYFMNSAFKPAQHELSQAKSLLPNDIAIINNLALSYMALGDIALAEDLWQGIIKQNEKFDVALHNYAHLLCNKDEFVAAEEYYKKALLHNEKNVVTSNDLACCMYMQGKIDNAISLLKTIAQSTEYKFQPAVFNIGCISLMENKIQFDQSV